MNMSGFSLGSPRRSIDNRRKERSNFKNSSRGHRESVARGLDVKLEEISSGPPVTVKEPKKPNKRGPSVLQLSASAAALCRPCSG